MRKASSGTLSVGAQRFALVPQDYAFYPQLTVQENLNFFLGVGHGKSLDKLAIARVLDVTQLTQVQKKIAGHLSGGLKRRLNFAIGLLHEPDLLLLDEPTVGVDPQSRAHLLRLVSELARDGTSIIYTSHYMEEVQAVADAIAIMDQGKIITHGELDTLLTPEPHLYQLELSNLDAVDWHALPTGAYLKQQIGNRCAIKLPNQEMLMALINFFEAQNIRVIAMREGFRDLEQLFMQLTQHQLRE